MCDQGYISTIPLDQIMLTKHDFFIALFTIMRVYTISLASLGHWFIFSNRLPLEHVSKIAQVHLPWSYCSPEETLSSFLVQVGKAEAASTVIYQVCHSTLFVYSALVKLSSHYLTKINNAEHSAMHKE